MDFSFTWTPVLQLLLAALLGAVIGIERDLNGRPAGLRTSMIIAMGSCLFAIISGEGYADAEGTPDPTRIASIVVQGIGFIGAGVMLKGAVWVTAGAAVTPADSVFFAAATGVISNISAGGTAIPGARFLTTAANGALVLLYLG